MNSEFAFNLTVAVLDKKSCNATHKESGRLWRMSKTSQYRENLGLTLTGLRNFGASSAARPDTRQVYCYRRLPPRRVIQLP